MAETILANRAWWRAGDDFMAISALSSQRFVLDDRASVFELHGDVAAAAVDLGMSTVERKTSVGVVVEIQFSPVEERHVAGAAIRGPILLELTPVHIFVTGRAGRRCATIAHDGCRFRSGQKQFLNVAVLAVGQRVGTLERVTGSSSVIERANREGVGDYVVAGVAVSR